VSTVAKAPWSAAARRGLFLEGPYQAPDEPFRFAPQAGRHRMRDCKAASSRRTPKEESCPIGLTVRFIASRRQEPTW